MNLPFTKLFSDYTVSLISMPATPNCTDLLSRDISNGNSIAVQLLPPEGRQLSLDVICGMHTILRLPPQTTISTKGMP